MTAWCLHRGGEPWVGSVCWMRGLCVDLPIDASPYAVLWCQNEKWCKTTSPCWSFSFQYIYTSCGLRSWCDNTMDNSIPALCHDNRVWMAELAIW